MSGGEDTQRSRERTLLEKCKSAIEELHIELERVSKDKERAVQENRSQLERLRERELALSQLELGV